MDGRTGLIAERELVELTEQLDRGRARWIELVAECDRFGRARAAGFRNTAEWLAWRCDLGSRAAREHVRVARRLTELPATRDAFADGRLSYSKVRAITRANPGEAETGLLARAEALTAIELEAHIRALPSSPSARPDVERAVYEARYLAYHWQDDGALRVHARLPATDGAAFIEALETAAEALHPAPAGAEPQPRPGLPARRADALCEWAYSGAPATRVLLHTTPETICHLHDGPAIPTTTARRLACDAVTSSADASGNLGREQRVVSPALRSALDRRDGGCKFPGCQRRHGLHAHHIRHWADGGPTDKANLILVCRYHHRLLHEEGWNATPTGQFTRPDGNLLPAVATRGGAPP